MIVATQYSAVGMHAGLIVVLRQIHGPQLWTIDFEVDRADGHTVTHRARADQPMLLRELGTFANGALDALAAAGEIEMRDGCVVAKDVRWKAWYRPNLARTKRRRKC